MVTGAPTRWNFRSPGNRMGRSAPSTTSHPAIVESKDGAPGRLLIDGLRKKHGLQGPIDDAFMERFLFVRPTGTADE